MQKIQNLFDLEYQIRQFKYHDQIEKQETKLEGLNQFKQKLKKNGCCNPVIDTLCTQKTKVKIALENCSKRITSFLNAHMVFIGNAFFKMLKQSNCIGLKGLSKYALCLEKQ
ncbi:unnamed protein product [Paramecium octaurelia]|uniref:Uncharacterized protein n=1 Tax=Paramecium octaurelia TaxID=43137 RepID=A0A8S1X9Q7_PAROT|nr:unnamed protein product [Paramecium octaurelia]